MLLFPAQPPRRLVELNPQEQTEKSETARRPSNSNTVQRRRGRRCGDGRVYTGARRSCDERTILTNNRRRDFVTEYTLSSNGAVNAGHKQSY